MALPPAGHHDDDSSQPDALPGARFQPETSNVIPFTDKVRTTSERSGPFGVAWESVLANLAEDSSPEAVVTADWLKANAVILKDFDVSSEALLGMQHFHTAYWHQMGGENDIADIEIAGMLSAQRFGRYTETDKPPEELTDDSTWAGQRYRHMLYMTEILRMKGYEDPSYAPARGGEDSYNDFGDLADMVYPDMLFGGRYPDSGIIHKPPFDWAINNTARGSIDWGEIGKLKEQYAATHLGPEPGNVAIRWNWTDDERATASEEGAQLTEKLREAYDAPQGLEQLTLEQLLEVRRRFGHSIKDASHRKQEMTLDNLDNQLHWVNGMFDEASDNPSRDRLRTQLNQDLIFIVASALRSAQTDGFDHTAMIRSLITTRLGEEERAKNVLATSGSHEVQKRLALKHVQVARELAVEQAKREEAEANVRTLSRRAIELVQTG